MSSEGFGEQSGEELTLHTLLRAMMDYGASDLHITTGSPPQLRIDGALSPLKTPPLNSRETKRLCFSLLTEAQQKRFERDRELDFSFGVKNMARFRANFFVQRSAVAAAIRKLSFDIPGFDELGLPESVKHLANRPAGLVLVTGPTGSGKSTTLAALIDMINANRRAHIITIEDPIEYLHAHKKSIINQREVRVDTDGFKDALRYVLRQDPDVILIGEMRDLETMETALTLSETGHLVFASLHTNSATNTIRRIINAFSPESREPVRQQLSYVLLGVISQQLLPRVGGGRVLASEYMVANTAIRRLIRDDKIHQIYSHIQVGQAKYGTQTMNQCLVELLGHELITEEDAVSRSPDAEELERMLNLG